MDGRSLDLDLTIGGIPCSTGDDHFNTEEVYGGGGDPGDGEAGGGGWFHNGGLFLLDLEHDQHRRKFRQRS